MTTHNLASGPIVRCRGTADFLAALPHLTGFTADDSVFVVCFIGARSGAAVRFDLPESEAPSDTASLLDFLSGLTSDITHTHGEPCAVAIVITSSKSFVSEGGPPWRQLAQQIERRLRRDGVAVRELCVVASDGWVSFLDRRAPSYGRPLSEITNSPVARDALQHSEPPAALDKLGEIPAADPERASAIAREIAATHPFDSPGSERTSPPPLEPGAHSRPSPARLTAAAAAVRQLRSYDPASVSDTARLAQAATQSDLWLVIALGVLTRPEFPLELAADLPLGNFSGVPVDLACDVQADTEADRDAAHGPPPGWSIYRILASICPGFTEQDRLPHLCTRLGEAVAETPTRLRPGLLALSAWVWWLYGNQTVAQRQLRAALSIDPAHAVSLMVERLTSEPLYERLISAGAPRRVADQPPQSRRAAQQ